MTFRTVFALLSLIGLIAAGTTAPASATPRYRPHVVSETQVAERQVDLAIASPALGETVNVRLLTPDGWDERGPGDRWPVLFLLHGCCGDYTSWTAMTDVAELPELRHVLVVMPEAGDAGWYSDWWNEGDGGTPAWETFHLREVLPILSHEYGAGQQRVVAGLSMGGLGSLLYAGRHPGMFQAAASFSGVVHPLAEGGPEWVMGFVERYGFDPLRLWGDPVEQRSVWEEHDPAFLAKGLRRIPVYLSCGDGTAGVFDEPGAVNPLEEHLLVENEQTAAALRDAKVEVTTDFYGGGTHSWPYWERGLHRSMPMLLDALGVRAPA